MISNQIFERTELKYLLTNEQKDIVLNAIKPYMSIDQYGHTIIRNIYYDTPSYQLIRSSIEKPIYKEKLRIRSYQSVDDINLVYVELKKKYKGTVYKRRIGMSKLEATDYLSGNGPSPIENQISHEIDYFMGYYKDLSPKVFLCYERDAYFTIEPSDFRITFDNNIMYRTTDLDLKYEPYGKQILDKNLTLMEIKTSEAVPLYLTKVLSDAKIYKTSYSKYGNAYIDMNTQHGYESEEI